MKIGNNEPKTLWYIADPMCSWCWGFAPVIEQVRQNYAGRLTVELVLGGLRTGTKESIAAKQREEILHHWHNVQRMTGQPFRFAGAMPEGFIYDTEIACRGVVAVSIIDTEKTFPFFIAIQRAFYEEQLNVTKPEILSQLAANFVINAGDFMRTFESDAAKKQTFAHFDQAHCWGVYGFPSLVTKNTSGHALLVSGYCSVEKLYPQLDTWLNLGNR